MCKVNEPDFLESLRILNSVVNSIKYVPRKLRSNTNKLAK